MNKLLTLCGCMNNKNISKEELIKTEIDERASTPGCDGQPIRMKS